MTRVAFLGLGAMGLPMARRVLGAGHELSVWNRTPGRAAHLGSEGVRVADSPADAAAGAEVVITMLADPSALEQVVSGSGGVVETIDADAVLTDMSTVGPTATASIVERVRPTPVLDAPVLGSVPHAEAGTLTILVGGDAATLARCRGVLETMGTIQHVGASGAGASIKLANNAAVMSSLVALGEALAATDRAGLDPEVVLDAVGSGPLASFVDRFRAKITGPGERVDFRLALARKDLALARDEAHALGLDPAQLAATIAVCDAAIAAGLGDGDNTGVAGFLRSTP